MKSPHEVEDNKPEAEFQISELLGIGMTLVVLVIGLAYGLEITGDIRDDFITNTVGCNTSDTTGCSSAEWNATTNGITALAKIPQKLTTVVTIIMAAVVIGILLRYLYVRISGGS